MVEIKNLFKLHNARSKAFKDHEKGEVTFVSNGTTNNGIVGYVKPLKGERVFNFMGICVSAFCEATVQFPPFIARGNGGSGLTVLESIQKMTYEEMLHYATTINLQLSWKFSFGRMVKRDRLRRLKVAKFKKTNVDCDLSKKIPVFTKYAAELGDLTFKEFTIDELFHLERGDFHSMRILKEGPYPTVSRTTENNGIVGYFSIPKKATSRQPPAITVSTTSGDAFVQLEEFLATDNVVICKPRKQLKLATIFFVCFSLNREKWRYSYGRQCYKEKFAKTIISLPVDANREIDEEKIEAIVSGNSYWEIITKALSQSQKRIQRKPTLNQFIS